MRDLFVSVGDLVEFEIGDDALAFGVLGDFERDVQVDHAAEHPTDVRLRVADQPPVFHWVCLFCAGGRLEGGSWQALFNCAALQHRYSCSLQKLIEVLGVATRLDVQIGVITRGRRALDRRILFLSRKFLETVIHLLRD